MDVYLSNRIENLFEALRGNVYGAAAPFARRLVMVATPPLKAWVMLELAEKSGIAAGIEIGTVEESFRKLMRPEKPFPKTEEVALGLEIEILKVMEDSFRDEKWEPLVTYLGNERKKITPFTFELARLFQKYNLYGTKLGKEWEREGWQRTLWDKLFAEQNAPWSSPYLEYAQAEPAEMKMGTLDVFAVSFIPKVQLDFLLRLSKKMEVRLYCLSPCESFWSDLAASKDQPLLANFGKIGRVMARWIEESGAETFEIYHQGKVKTLLEHIQEDMRTLRDYSETPPKALPSDCSVQVHGAPSYLREVEVVQQVLLEIVSRGGIEPRDILVMAPDISLYAPFIPAVFDGEFFTPHVSDLRMPALEPLIQLFLQLVSFACGRWSSQDFLVLLESPFFYKKQGWDRQEVATIKEWIENCPIRWGEDPLHRQTLLKQIYGEAEESIPYAPGTWEFGIHRLLAGLIRSDHEQVVPYAAIESTQGELLGELIDLTHALKKDLAPLVDGSHLTLVQWSEKLRGLFTTYFNPAGGEAQGEQLLKIIEGFRRLGVQFGETLLPFSTILKHLEYSLNQSSTRYKESNLQTVRFCSLLPLRTVPAKVVVLMGMEEGAFPRSDNHLSFDLLHQNPLVDFCPTRADMDRFIFLEALLSARTAIIFTYQSKGKEDLKDQGPGLLVEELLQAVKRGYLTEILHLVHPVNRFDSCYFTPGSPFKSFSMRDFEEAEALIKEKLSPHRFIVDFPLPKHDFEPIDILRFEDLKGFVKDPLKVFFNKTLGIFIEEEHSKKEEPFIHSPLEFSGLKRKLLQKPVDAVLEQAKKEGLLPVDLFQDATKQRLQEELKAIASFGIPLEDIEEVEFALPLSVILKGKIPLVTPEGLMVYKEKNKESLIEVWPLFLVYLALRKGKPQLLFLKDGKIADGSKINPEEELEELIDYYRGALSGGSPLDPRLFTGKKSFSPYLEWLQREGELSIATEWNQKGEKLFGSILGEA